MPVVWTNPDIIYLWFMFSHVPAKEVSPKLVTQLPVHFNRTQNPFDLKIDMDARVQTAVSKGVRPVISVEMNLCICSVLCKGGEIYISSVRIKEAATNSLPNAFPMIAALHTFNIEIINFTSN